MTQCAILARLLRRKCGVTSMEIIEKCRTVSPHKRLSELKDKGWVITRRQVPGRSYGVYFGVGPKAA